MTTEAISALWAPSAKRVASAQLTAFMKAVRAGAGFDADGDYFALHRWSLDEPAAFWRAVWDFTEIQGDPGETICDDPMALPGCQWFPDATLNFAENLLRVLTKRKGVKFSTSEKQEDETGDGFPTRRPRACREPNWGSGLPADRCLGSGPGPDGP